jgi:peptidoglycan/xylan/chitin deacetylase (PgdA/CDA1 family)
MFKTHMKILEQLRFTPINLTQLEDYRNGISFLPKKPVLITFDDCYQECIDHAVPILEEKGFTAVFYMPTDYAGTDSHWLMPELGFEFPIINWETVRRLDLSGFQIGSHSMSHPRLAQISPKDCFNELDSSRKILEDKLGHEIVHLAYPYGSFDENVRALAAETGYRTACTTEERFSRPEDDPLLLPRIDIFGYYNIFDFVLKLHFEGKYNTTRRWWQYTYGKMRGVGRLAKKIRKKFTEK